MQTNVSDTGITVMHAALALPAPEVVSHQSIDRTTKEVLLAM